ncbi:VCBS domain-containing protein [Desulfovibrio sp. SGI.169]|uniref:VCBS domain-containing protein n=1 Tax=Desulfovibrio sp. SGI.169 TaxID=3420561 RepID=UPI003D05A6BF
MADIRLFKVSFGTKQTIACAPDSRFICDFPTAEATMTRSGDDLVFTFDDGGSIELTGFYTAYNAAKMPDFEVDGAIISGADFFTAMNEPNLMPAAGPAAGANNGARYHEYANASLMEGIDHLDGLDLTMDFGVGLDERREGVGGDDSEMNGAPVVISVDAAAVVEAGVHTGGNEAKAGVPVFHGQVNVADPNGDSLSFGFIDASGNVVTSITTNWGVIAIDPATGAFTYELNNGNANALAEGDIRQESFTVRVSDGRGGSATANVDVTITGSNDIPSLELTRENLFVSAEDAPNINGDIVDAGTAKGDDPDTGHVLHYSFGKDGNGDPILSLTDEYGTLTIDPDSGEYSYTLHKDSDAVKVLKGDGADDVVQRVAVVVTDEHGAHAEESLDIVIRGANDEPVIAMTGKAELGLVESGVFGSEMNAVDGVMNDGGSFTVFEKDANDAQSLSAVIEGLDPKEYTVRSDMASGVTTVSTAYGVFTVTPFVVTDAYGSTATTYNYSFNLFDENNPGYGDAAGRLNAGQSLNLPFRLTVTDGAGKSVEQNVNVTITGTNDKPELTLSDTNLVIGEDATGHGALAVSDDDADGALADGNTVNHKFEIAHRPGENDDISLDRSAPSSDYGEDAVFETKYGTLTVRADGTYTFTPSDAAQNLGEGKDVTLNFDITVTDRHEAHDAESVTVVIKGSNDQPGITAEGSGKLTLKEAGVGDKTITGIDDGWAEGSNQAKINGIAKADGRFTVRETDEGDTLSLTVKNVDGNVVTLQRDPATGELYVKDAYGTLLVTENTVVNPDGSHEITYGYRYELDNVAVNGLKQYDESEGATHIEGEDHYSGKYTFSVTDGKSAPVEHDVDILIKGTNDGPTVKCGSVLVKEEGVYMENGDGNTATAEDGKNNDSVFSANHRTEVSGHIDVSDPDQRSGFDFSVKLSDQFGAGNKVDHYQGQGSGSTPLLDADGNVYQSEVVINPTGSSVSDNVQIIATNYGTLTFHKQDWTEILDDGSAVPHKAGDYGFALNGETAQSLAKGEKLDFSFTVTVTDEHGAQGHHQIGVTIEGSNDVPTLILKDDGRDLVAREAGVGVEASQSKADSTADSSDDDHNAGRSFGLTLGDAPDAEVRAALYMDRSGHLLTEDNAAACVGKLVINPDTGEYHFELFNDRDVVQAMNNGDVVDLADKVNVRVTDEHGAYDQAPITIRVEGANDAPTATASSLTVKEDGVFKGNVGTVEDKGGSLEGSEHRSAAASQIRVQDVDNALSGGSAGGRWKYAGESDGFTFRLVHNAYTRVNGDGLSAEHLLSGGGDFNAVWAQIRSDAFPPDQLAALNTALKAAAADGSLNVGDSLNTLIQGEAFNIADLKDGQARSILSSVSLGTLTLDPATGEYSFAMSPEGSLGHMINNIFGSSYSSIREFSVAVADPAGGVSTVRVKVEIRGSNDRPELKLEDNPDHDVTDQADLVATGALSALDPDASDTHQYSIVKKDANGNDARADLTERNHDSWTGRDQSILNDATSTTVEGKYGTLTITKDANGKPAYEYHVNHDKVVALSGEDTVEESFSIVVRDKGGAFDIKDVTFTVHGADDGPRLTVATADAHVLDVKEFGVTPGANTPNNASGEASGSFDVQWTDSNAEGEQNQHYGFMLNGKLLSAVDGNGEPVVTTGRANGHEYSITGSGNGAGSSLEITIDGIHYGSLSINADGKFTFRLDHDSLNGMDENWHTRLSELLGDNIRLVAWDDRHDAFDGDGNLNSSDSVADQKLDVYFSGANDRPVFEQTDDARNASLGGDGLTWTAGSSAASFTENDANRVIEGRLGGSDAEGDALTFAIVKPDGSLVQKIQGEYGILEVRPDGGYTYALTVSGGEFEHLNKDELLQAENFAVRITDEHGASTDGRLQITVKGEHDDFKLSAGNLTVTENNGELSRAEDATSSTHGKITPSGVDLEDIEAIVRGDISWNLQNGEQRVDGTIVSQGAYGKLALDPSTGAYHYELDNSKIQQWNTDRSDQEQFIIQTTINGVTVDKAITVTVNGANDRPEWLESGALTGIAKPFVKDVDHTDGKADMRFEGRVSGGTDIDDNDSSLQYMLTNGEKSANGDFVASTVLKTAYGAFVIDPVTGEYSYTVDGYSAALGDYFRNNPEASTLTDTIKIVVVDPYGAQSETTREIQISINKSDLNGGGGEEPVYRGGDLAGTVVEDGDSDDDPTAGTNQTISGQLDATHAGNAFFGLMGADGRQTQTGIVDHPAPISGKYGFISVDPATGRWTYTLFNGKNGEDNPVQNLAAGATVTEEFAVMLNGQPVFDAEGNEVKIVITIEGVNDAPEITHVDASQRITGVVTEADGHASITGKIEATDADRDGTGNMEKLSVSFSGDGVAQPSTEGSYGVITLAENANGSWSYTYALNPEKLAADPEASTFFRQDGDGAWHLINGAALQETFKIYVSDGHGGLAEQEISIDINGRNFAPVFAGSEAIRGESVTEDGFGGASGTVESVISKSELAKAFTDDEGTDNLRFMFENGKTFMEDEKGYGVWQIDAEGNLAFTLNNQSAAVQGLGANDAPTVSITVYARDEHGEPSAEGVDVTVAIQGSGDAPQLIVEKALAVAEASESNGRAEGVFHLIDADMADSRENLTYEVTDGSTAVEAKNGGALTFTNEYGTLTLNPATGGYSFALNSESEVVRGMKPGELYEIRFDVKVADHDGLTGSGQIIVNIKGSNTAPEIDSTASVTGNDADAALVEGADGSGPVFTGAIVARDVDADADDTLNYSFALTDEQRAAGWSVSNDGKTLTATYGTATIKDNGEYSYTLDNKRADALAEGEKTHETFHVAVTDKYGARSDAAEVTIHVEGSNDAPKIEGSSLAHGVDGVCHGQLSFSDVDAQDSHTATFAGLFDQNLNDLHVNLAELEDGASLDVYNAAGDKVGALVLHFTQGAGATDVLNYVFTPDDAYASAINRGEDVRLDFSVTVGDGHNGAVVQNGLSISLTSTNKAPEISAPAPESVNANRGELLISDADSGNVALTIALAGESLNIPQNGQEYALGNVTFSYANGILSYAISEAHTNAMAPGAESSLDFSVILNDGHGDMRRDVSLAAHSTNEAPTVGGNVFSGFENDVLHGQLVGVDDDHTDADALLFRLDDKKAPQYGTVHVESDGSYTYTPHGEAPSGAVIDSFSIMVDDGHGGVTGHEVTVHFDDQILAGSEDEDSLFGGYDDDLIFYDPSDYLVHGGSGIDFLLSGSNDDLHLKDILANDDPNSGPLVNGVEVLLKGDELAALTSQQELEEYGITVKDNTLILEQEWMLNHDGYYENGSLILETTLTPSAKAEDGTTVFEKLLQAGESVDTLLGSSEKPDEARQGGSGERSLDLTNMDASLYPGLDSEDDENAASENSPMATVEGIYQNLCGAVTTEDHADEEAVRAAVNTIQAGSGGC